MDILLGVALVALSFVFPASGPGSHSSRSAQAQRPNFSGVWQQDRARTTTKRTPKNNATGQALPPPPPPDEDEDPPKVTIRHKEPTLGIMVTSSDGEDVSVLNLTTDGKLNTNEIGGDGNVYNKSTSHWDGEKLVTEWTIEQYGQQVMKGTNTRYLAEDGKTMIVEQRFETDNALVEVHEVFVRTKT